MIIIPMNAPTHYDIIADIHGRYDKLANLMERLGYQPAAVGFIPPAGHRALFLGDLIDTKPGHPFPGGIRATLRAVKAMCDRGHALCLMGNHEWNAILFHSANPDGEPLKENSPRNTRTHQGTLEDFPDHVDPAGEWRTVWLPWLKTLPFFLDLGDFRAVHATWHPEMIARIGSRSLVDDAFLLAAYDKNCPEGVAVETLLCGAEVDLPAGITFTDHTGRVRSNMRACWWELPTSGIRYDQLVFPPHTEIPDDPVSEESFGRIPGYASDAPPVFFGHYLKPAQSPLYPERHNVACLDHSAATGGPLVAYRWNGGPDINPEHYICHS